MFDFDVITGPGPSDRRHLERTNDAAAKPLAPPAPVTSPPPPPERKAREE